MAVIISSMASWSEGQTPPNQWSLGLSLRESRQFDRVVNDGLGDGRITDSASVNFGYSTNRERSSLSLFARGSELS